MRLERQQGCGRFLKHLAMRSLDRKDLKILLPFLSGLQKLDDKRKQVNFNEYFCKDNCALIFL